MGPSRREFRSSLAEELQRCYNDLDGQTKERSIQLQNALTQSQGIQDSLDSLLAWLDEAERNVHKMEKGTVLVVKRDPLVENLQQQKVGTTRAMGRDLRREWGMYPHFFWLGWGIESSSPDLPLQWCAYVHMV